ncbi:MAG: hypothetical protein ACRC80_37210 [Waterburya sp.]
MILEKNSVLGEISVEEDNECKILRCVYHFRHGFYPVYCLIRIFEFHSKTVVIASHLSNSLLWDESLIENIIKDFNLDYKNLHWLNHRGLFSCLRITDEEFLYTFFSCQKNTPLSKVTINIIKDQEITLQEVEGLIKHSLEPIKFWLGLDPIVKKNIQQKREKQLVPLSYLYFQSKIEYFSKNKEVAGIISNSIPGAIFFYPNQNKFEFLEYSRIESSNNKLKQKSLAYIEKSFPEREVVICICLEDFSPFCIIIPKEIFISPYFKVDFSYIERSVDCGLNLCEQFSLDLIEYREHEQREQERKKSLLDIYLKLHLEDIISQFEESEVFYQSRLDDIRGVLDYYPEQDTCIFVCKDSFREYHEETEVYDLNLNEYDVETEVVICVQLNSQSRICGIYSK